MVGITVKRNALKLPVGFRSEGHADFDDEGRDIICAAVSVLELNLANSVAEFTDARFSCQIGEDTGTFEFLLADREDEKAALLLDSCLLGMEAIRQQYGSNYLQITDQEV